MSEMSHSLTVQIATVKGTHTVQVRGEVDLQTAPQLRDLLLDTVKKQAGDLLVDLSQVGYMDSSGVASLVKLLARVRREKVSLKLAGLTPRVRSVFEITRLDSVFEICASVEEALRS